MCIPQWYNKCMDLKIIEKIKTIDDKICGHISEINVSNRGSKSQDILSVLRHYVEHIMLLIYSSGRNLDDSYDNIVKSIKFIKSKGQYRRLTKLHEFLEIVVSHYVQDPNDSERLMLKYIDFLYEIRSMLKTNFNIETLHNLDSFPQDVDTQLLKYYERIVEKIDETPVRSAEEGRRFYIDSVKTIYRKNNDVYYEISFNLAVDNTKKTDRLIAYSKIKMLRNYSVKLSLRDVNIEIDGLVMPIVIIDGWEVAIRDCEFKNFIGCVNGKKLALSKQEKKNINDLLTRSKITFLDIIQSEPDEYNRYLIEICNNVRSPVFKETLNKCRDIVVKRLDGKNIIKYLLFAFNNNIIKAQYSQFSNNLLSNLYIDIKSIPFDKMPFYFSLKGHNPPSNVLYSCYDLDEFEEEIFARIIRNNTENNRKLFTSVKDVMPEEYVKNMINKFNAKLYHKHVKENALMLKNDYIFINGYFEDCKFILKVLKGMSDSGIVNYSKSVKEWINNGNSIDSEEKENVLIKMFEKSKVALIYGAAGTGKSTMLKHISNYLQEKKKLYLAQTNPAVDNLKRKIKSKNSDFATIAKYNSSDMKTSKYDVLIVDECSTVSNTDIRKILESNNFQLMILVGDIYQIQSIRFGNWFDFARKLIDKKAVFELTNPYRTRDEGLLRFWKELRAMSCKVKEVMIKNKYSSNIDKTIFCKTDRDEIVLCLNYNGLYGINNINRLIQKANENISVSWGVNKYKIDDPVIFLDTERFKPIIYNNMKGKIRNIIIKNEGLSNESILFDIEIDRTLTDIDIGGLDIELVDDNYEHENSVIRIEVYKNISEEDDDILLNTIVPFQISYAVSFHKSQGLEYDSVKIVVTDDVQDSITHNILYTAATRAKKNLKIYWSPEVEQKVLSTIKPFDVSRDINIFKSLQELETNSFHRKR